MTLTSSESSMPTSILVPLRASSDKEPDDDIPTPSIFHHPNTALISNIQYGTAPKQTSRQFENPQEVVCYAHTSPLSNPDPSHAKSNRRSNRSWKNRKQSRLQGFRQSDGVIDFANKGGKWFGHGEEVVGGFS
ncbi:MAG: hypothetical protein Q9201_004070, partial [Fulgogasparrea decipioides]